MDDEKQALQKQLDSSEQQYADVSNDKNNLKTQLDQLNSELDQSHRANSEMSGEVESLREKCAQLSATNVTLTEQASEAADGKEAAYQQSLLRLQDENSNLQTSHSSLFLTK